MYSLCVTLLSVCVCVCVFYLYMCAAVHVIVCVLVCVLLCVRVGSLSFCARAGVEHGTSYDTNQGSQTGVIPIFNLAMSGI